MEPTTKYRPLSRKELETLELLGKGYVRKEMKGIFGISENGVDRRIDSLRRRLGVPQHVSAAAILPILAHHTEDLVPYANKRNPPTNMTERQREVLHYITSGMKQSEVAKAMRISQKSVESHMESIRSLMRKRLRRDKITIVELTHYAIAHRITPLQFTEKGVYDHRTLELTTAAAM